MTQGSMLIAMSDGLRRWASDRYAQHRCALPPPFDMAHYERALASWPPDDPVGADAFIKSFHVTYPSLNDPSDDLALAFRGTVPPAAIPTTLVIDRSGHIAARILGSVSYDSLRALITQVTRG